MNDYQGKDMCCLDLRFLVPYAINILKIFQVGILARDWDPYNIIGNPSWMKVSWLLLFLTAFSFLSIETPLISTRPQNPRSVRLCLSVQYSLSMGLSLLASLLLPQELFWYVNPAIILLSFFCSSPRILNLLIWLHAAASRLPCFIDGSYPGEEGFSSGAGSEVGDLEANDVGDIQDQQSVVVTIDDKSKK